VLKLLWAVFVDTFMYPTLSPERSALEPTWIAWALATSMNVGTVGRITAGALYMASVGIAGKFNPGHVQLAISLAWVPLVLAGLWWTQ
jgi:hypothetical protein